MNLNVVAVHFWACFRKDLHQAMLSCQGEKVRWRPRLKEAFHALLMVQDQLEKKNSGALLSIAHLPLCRGLVFRERAVSPKDMQMEHIQVQHIQVVEVLEHSPSGRG